MYKGYVLPWQHILKASDGLIFSPVESVSISLTWLYEYNCDWDVFFWYT